MNCQTYIFLTLLLFLGIKTSSYAQELRLQKLGLGINTEQYEEIAPLISPDGNTLYFTRVGDPNFVKTLMIDGKDKSLQADYESFLRSIYTNLANAPVHDPSRSSFNQDVWIAHGDEFQFFELNHPGPPLNNALPNSICGVTPDPNKFIVINQFPETGGMQEGFSTIRHLGDNQWSQPEPLIIDDYYTLSDGVSLTMSHDGELLLMSLNREEGHGGNDLYVSFKIEENHYSTPLNLGWNINTGFEEITPSISEDKWTVYFATNRGGTGRDIYFARRLDDTWTNWAIPRRFNQPINSNRDDSQPHFNPASGYLYFVSNREGTNDLYRVRILEPKPERSLPQRAAVRLQIINGRTGDLLAGNTYVKRSNAERYQNVFKVSEKGSENIMPGDGEYTFLPKVEGYIGHPQTVSLQPTDNPRTIQLIVDPVEENGIITTRPIYFERSQALIKKESHPAIDDLVLLLRNHPELSIRIEGHTDSNGGIDELQALSQQRANAVRDFLIRQGIAAERLKAQGFGASRPIAANDTEHQRERNRRVEIRIERTKNHQ